MRPVVAHLDCEQGTEEWHMGRLGLLTSSNFGKVYTATGKFSSQAGALRKRLIAEILIKRPLDTYQSYAMTDGYNMQPEAVDFYQFEKNVDVEAVGLFIRTDGDSRCGSSPDGRIQLLKDGALKVLESQQRYGGLEIKCPEPQTHVEILETQEMPTKHIAQVQGGLFVTGWEWWDFLSYNPAFPPEMRGVIIRILPDPDYQHQLAQMIESFNEKLAEQIASIRKEYGK